MDDTTRTEPTSTESTSSAVSVAPAASGGALIKQGLSVLLTDAGRQGRRVGAGVKSAGRGALTSARTSAPRPAADGSTVTVAHARTAGRVKLRNIAIGLIVLAMLYLTVLHGPVHAFANYVQNATHPHPTVSYVPIQQAAGSGN